jgi:uncharacterized protein YndB with AHSA1/START domain
MASYERSRWINAREDVVFRFATALRNMPTYIPTVKSVEWEPGGKTVRVKGEVRGQPFEDRHCWLKIDSDRNRMEWSAEGHDYSGWMTITKGDNASGGAQVVVNLTVPPWVSPSGRPITGEPPGPNIIEESLEDSLNSLRNMIEGRGGEEIPPPLQPTDTGAEAGATG